MSDSMPLKIRKLPPNRAMSRSFDLGEVGDNFAFSADAARWYDSHESRL
jgi:hypothetical protein